MAKQRGLPATARMRHDHHFVEQLAVRHTEGIGQKIRTGSFGLCVAKLYDEMWTLCRIASPWSSILT